MINEKEGKNTLSLLYGLGNLLFSNDNNRSIAKDMDIISNINDVKPDGDLAADINEIKQYLLNILK